MPTDVQRSLLDDLIELTPQQPATVYFRSIELEPVLEQAFPPGVGLDVGCGDGRLMTVLARHDLDARFVGLDIDPTEVELARESGIYDRVVCASAHEIPESDRSFDFAFSNSVLEHVPDLPRALSEIARVLKPGAPFVITVPIAQMNESFQGTKVLGWLLGRDRDVYLRKINDRLIHLNMWTVDQWHSELESAGFDVAHEVAYLSVDQTRRWEKLANWTGGLVYGLSNKRKPLVEYTRTLKIASGTRGAAMLAPVTRRVAKAALKRTRPPTESEAFSCRLFVARRSA